MIFINNCWNISIWFLSSSLALIMCFLGKKMVRVVLLLLLDYYDFKIMTKVVLRVHIMTRFLELDAQTWLWLHLGRLTLFKKVWMCFTNMEMWYELSNNSFCLKIEWLIFNTFCVRVMLEFIFYLVKKSALSDDYFVVFHKIIWHVIYSLNGYHRCWVHSTLVKISSWFYFLSFFSLLLKKEKRCSN